MNVAVIAPDEHAVREHLRGGRFQAGVAADRWHLISIEWPFITVAVHAAQRPGAPDYFVLHLEVSGYPHAAPTGSLWDTAAKASLVAEQRPKGERVALLFRADGWVAGSAAVMYAPWDRTALQSHPNWAQQYPHDAWNPTRNLSFIFSNVHEYLNADDYLGI